MVSFAEGVYGERADGCVLGAGLLSGFRFATGLGIRTTTLGLETAFFLLLEVWHVLGVEAGVGQLRIVDRRLADFRRRERAHVDVGLIAFGVGLLQLGLLFLSHHPERVEHEGELRIDLAE
jgi:hypothetical protein